MSASLGEMKFARALANPLKEIRDKTVNDLNKHLSCATKISELDMSKLWKALYYCLWLADKAPIQYELAKRISEMQFSFKKNKLWLLFFKIFFRILFREWDKLDQYRVNKFYTLIRMIVKDSIVKLSSARWPNKTLNNYLQIIEQEILVKKPNGIRFHLADIYLSEIANATNGQISTIHFMKLLSPFFISLSNTDDIIFHERIIKKIFKYYLITFARENNNQNKNLLEKSNIKSTDIYFLNVDTTAIQASIFAIASDPNTRDGYRHQIYALHKEFQKVTQVQFAPSFSIDQNNNNSIDMDTNEISGNSIPMSQHINNNDDSNNVESNQDISNSNEVHHNNNINNSMMKTNIKKTKKSKENNVEMDSNHTTNNNHTSASNTNTIDNNNLISMNTEDSLSRETPQPDFIPSKTFLSSKEGYVFQKVRSNSSVYLLIYSLHYL